MPEKNKHLTLDQRYIIQQSLGKLPFKKIAEKLGKDCTTISREVRRHTITVYTRSWGKVFNDCTKRDRCPVVRVSFLLTLTLFLLCKQLVHVCFRVKKSHDYLTCRPAQVVEHVCEQLYRKLILINICRKEVRSGSVDFRIVDDE